MQFQHDKSWDHLITVLASKMPVKDAWNEFIHLHEKAVPKSYWTTLRQIEVEAEQEHIISWLQHVVTGEPIPENVVAIWIGILKFAGDDDQEIPAIYFVGADTYDKEDIDWACDPSYLPENRYAQPGVLREIDTVARTDPENYEFFDWILPIAYCAFTFDDLIRTKLNIDLFLKHKSKLFVSVGHDSGDYINLTSIQKLDSGSP